LIVYSFHGKYNFDIHEAIDLEIASYDILDFEKYSSNSSGSHYYPFQKYVTIRGFLNK
jgi:hypothetical protein